MTNTGSGDDGWSSWYVLTTSCPQQLEDLIEQENADSGGRYECYCPFTALPQEDAGSRGDSQFSLRAALRRYVFVRMLKTVPERLFVTTLSAWNHNSTHSFRFLRNGDGTNAKVSQRQLDIMKAHCDMVLIKPEGLAASGLKVGQKINLSATPFGDSHQEGIIQSITRKRGGMVELRVEMTLFNVRFSNLLITLENQDGGPSFSRQVYDAQQNLLAIFRRKVNGKETEASRQHDAQTLQDILHMGHLSLPDGALRRHHLALMLICARLSGDAVVLRQYTGMVNALLADLSSLRESKAATDSRAWLHIALFIATGQPLYRDLAKTYIRVHTPKSTYLLQFIKQSCKTAGTKWIGVKKNREKTK